MMLGITCEYQKIELNYVRRLVSHVKKSFECSINFILLLRNSETFSTKSFSSKIRVHNIL